MIRNNEQPPLVPSQIKTLPPPPAAEDCRGVAQSLDSLRSLGMPSEVEARQDPQPIDQCGRQPSRSSRRRFLAGPPA